MKLQLKIQGITPNFSLICLKSTVYFMEEVVFNTNKYEFDKSKY